MIDLRFIERDGKRVLQWRQVGCQIGWSKCDDKPVIQPKEPIYLTAENNWGPWQDVPFEPEAE
jgi:hypothetical protein